MRKKYSIGRSRRILRMGYELYRKKRKKLSLEDRSALESHIKNLESALTDRDRILCDEHSRKVESFCHRPILRKSLFSHIFEFCFALLFALVIATVIRQMWFEPYEIPTASMRPTFKERDRLIVTKTNFGLNIPMKPDQFYFDHSLVQRGGTVTFTVEGMNNIADQDTKYFGIFPSKKRYVKRLIGKPGDSFYFYGGLLYGVDAEGEDIIDFREDPLLSDIEHIPFTVFDGFTNANIFTASERSSSRSAIFSFFGEPRARLRTFGNGAVSGELFVDGSWVEEDHPLDADRSDRITKYSDFFGIRNFAMCRLLTLKDVKLYTNFSPEDLDDGILYLEISHTPSLTYPKPQAWPAGNGAVITKLESHRSIIALDRRHLDVIMENMYTSRFVIKNERGDLYNAEGQHFSDSSPSFPGILPGTYEFYSGSCYKVSRSGVTTILPEDHILYNDSPDNIKKLFNLGMDMHNRFMPFDRNRALFPLRYGYFRDGDLYLLGKRFLAKDDPALLSFHERERRRAADATQYAPYVAFKDHGPPIDEDGNIDIDFIRTFGITVPDKEYLVLGDNHAHSADSRFFGFLPESNIRGAPWKILWSYGDRWGSPNQPSYPFMTLPRLMVWGFAAFIAVISLLIRRYRKKRFYSV
ncbi:MAG: signal peptidase I [Waddliaceae bacterium]|jgi:signal peptidase I|nr:signal peptidase I [Waddliaceae bacterium]MBT3579472.1 signal peptidase I [Waddliaceae bacterium]MBT4445579.1 signal peptidase I [Waddliaceae bacterium]MBT6928229.1 signal peptidase I [Waddliaceae bacterium]MBT7264574.1 signal peptidase I [Waddliaceae bacterium]